MPAVLSPSPLPAHSSPTLHAARTAGAAFSLTLALALAAPSLHASLLTAEQRATLPAAATRPVDFVRDIQPIFEASCVQCHGRGKAKGSFSIETRADFLAGGDRGEPIVPGDSAHSLVVEMISGLSPDDVMPEKGKRLTAEQVALFRAWIDQGLAWPDSVNFHRHEPANLRPREVGTPAAAPGLEHPLDRWVDRYFRAQGAAWPAVVDDRTFARRVWFDTIGLPPPPDALAEFLSDPAPNRRERLVQRLLADDQGYAEHWLSFWNDLLRNDYRGTGYIDGGRKQITGWLYTALARNVPYDQFVAQLIHPNAEAEGFTRGILWRGAVNASMIPAMQASQNVAQVFLGVNLKCASCHDSFINEYTLADAYGLASVYADEPLEVAECDKPTGEFAQVKFLYAELGGIDPKASPEARKQRLVELITGQSNGRLPRTIVNRFWQRLLGHGLVEPVDEMDRPAWSPEIIDWLAEDFVAHGYDLKHLLTRILTSRTYQLESVGLSEKPETFVFRGPVVRRLSAEQFSDSLRFITLGDYGKAATRYNRNVGLSDLGDALPLRPSWIWPTAGAERAAAPGGYVFKRTFTLPAGPTVATLAVAADDNYTLRINGSQLGNSARRASTSADHYDVTPHLCAGENVIELIAENLPPDDHRGDPIPAHKIDNPAGLLAYLRIRIGDEAHDVVTDRQWTAVPLQPATPAAAAPLAVVELGGLDLSPWRLGPDFLDVAAAAPDTRPVARASLVAADPLMLALGRPNREQVVTVRLETATTLQALEMTNGGTLAALLRAGAQRVLAPTGGDLPAVIDGLYRRSLARPPTDAERALALDLVRAAPNPTAGIEDLIWALTMLPEFQLLR